MEGFSRSFLKNSPLLGPTGLDKAHEAHMEHDTGRNAVHEAHTAREAAH